MARIKTRTAKDGTPTYTAEVRLKGYPPEAATFKRKTDATKWIQNTESAMREGRHFKTTVSKKHTLEDAINRYLKDTAFTNLTPNEIRIRKPVLNWWKSQIGYLTLADLSASDFDKCKDTMQIDGGTNGKPLAPDTVHRYFLAIKHVLKSCVKWKLLSISPLKDSEIEMPKKPDGIVRYLHDEESNDELSRLTIACKQSRNKQLYAAFLVSVSTAMRLSENMWLYWRKPNNPPEFGAWGIVNLADKCIILEKTKNGKPRRVPLKGVALEELT
ncbi:MAG: site-specific integrase, partial [Methylobacter sp.]|nr:site-specific integrase [Methylobacter sp.]